MSKVIEVKNLTMDYGQGKGIFDLNFSIEKGEIVGFLGPNGAGKTTTIRVLLGLIKNHSGESLISTYNSKKDQIEIQKLIGYLPGEINFIDDLDGYQLIKLIADMRNIHDLSYAESLLKRFSLKPKQPIKKMSKGMKQKLGIVLAFFTKPEILILDEPSSGLDPLMQQSLIDLILEHKKNGATIFLSSHIFEEVEKTCTRVIMIKTGKIITDKPISDLKQQRLKAYEITFGNSKDLTSFSKDHQVTIKTELSCIYNLDHDLNTLLKDLTQYDVRDIARKDMILEEIFMQYYGD